LLKREGLVEAPLRVSELKKWGDPIQHVTV
jgi:hypothetical protein